MRDRGRGGDNVPRASRPCSGMARMAMAHFDCGSTALRLKSSPAHRGAARQLYLAVFRWQSAFPIGWSFRSWRGGKVSQEGYDEEVAFTHKRQPADDLPLRRGLRPIAGIGKARKGKDDRLG